MTAMAAQCTLHGPTRPPDTPEGTQLTHTRGRTSACPGSPPPRPLFLPIAPQRRACAWLLCHTGPSELFRAVTSPL